MSPETADVLFAWGNRVLLVSLAIGFLATYAIVVSGSVRDKSAAQKIAEAKTQAAVANATAARAHEGLERAKADIAEANARAAEATLQTERMRAAFALRTLSQSQFDKLVAEFVRLRPKLEGKFGIAVYAGDSEAATYAAQFEQALDKAGYKTRSSSGFGGEVKFYGVRVSDAPPDVSAILTRLLSKAKIPADVGHVTLPMMNGQLAWVAVSVRPPPH